MTNQVHRFSFPSEAIKRKWAVYIIVASHKISGHRMAYIGKVGDNRDGCNPILSRIGNHFSHTKTHSQMRKHMGTVVDDHCYEAFFTHFGCYESGNKESRYHIDECERELVRYAKAQEKTQQTLKVINDAVKSETKKQKAERQALLSIDDKLRLLSLAEHALAIISPNI